MPTDFHVKYALCDIEGTTTSIEFVKNVLFPYSKDAMQSFLSSKLEDETVKNLVAELLKWIQENSKDIATSSNFDSLTGESLTEVCKAVNTLIDKDFKIQPLKTLQGLIWEEGYRNDKLKGHIYSDVPENFKKWTSEGIKIYIYSSGSEKAQKLLFANSERGDLLKYISGHYDTGIGAKVESGSYSRIGQDLKCSQEEIVFFTDIVKEAEAATAAGINTVLLNRPGNAPLTDSDKAAFSVINSFDEISLKLLN